MSDKKADVLEIQPLEKIPAPLLVGGLSDPSPVEVKKPSFNALIWGPPGVGKTVLAATAADHPDLGPALVLNIEGGLLSLGTRKNIKKVDVSSFEQLEGYFWKLASRTPPFDVYKTVILDSGTELQSISLEGIVKAEFDKAKRKGGEAANKRDNIDEIFQGDYGKDSARLKRIMRWFRDIPQNVIITALSKKVFSKPVARDVEPQLVEVLPWFTEKLSQAVMGYVDFVWYLYVDEEGKRCIMTRDTGVYKGKTRGVKFAEAIGKKVVEPNLAQLYNKLLETEGAK